MKMGYNNIVLVFLLLIMLSCSKNKNHERGFLIREDNNHFWYYIPLKSMDTTSCVNDFKTENFNRGIKFTALQNVYLSENFDSVKIGTSSRYLKIMPVKMEYNIVDESAVKEGLTEKYSVRIDGGVTEFEYNMASIQVKKITPLFCYERKRLSCECQKSEIDKNDYLYKICEHLKTKGDLSLQPCKYKVNEVVESVYDGKNAIEVRLNCCYLGDRAYFDIKSKELIGFEYGPK